MSVMRKVLVFWPILAAVVALTAAAGTMQYRIGAVEGKAEQISAMDVRLARVEEAVGQLPEIRADIKELLKRSHE